MLGRALLVGIDMYDKFSRLAGCVSDALAMYDVVSHHEDRRLNFETQVFVSNDEYRLSRTWFQEKLADLFSYNGRVLFYFSGHGYIDGNGKTWLVTQDGTDYVPGILLHDLFEMANKSPASEVLIFLDSCHSGALGESTTFHINEALRDNITILAASRANEKAIEMGGKGLFTGLVVGALKGGAKDVRGRVSAASIYAYVEQALGAWDQRPIYRSAMTQLEPVRYCFPIVDDADLSRLIELFPTDSTPYKMNPTYEKDHKQRISEHVEIFQLFKRYRDAGMLKPLQDTDLYFTALNSTEAGLTPLGQYYWQLVKNHRITKSASPQPRRKPMPDPETVARIFHEAYERLAPVYDYKTRRATRKTWDLVPQQNKELMIATAAEVLAAIVAFQESEQSLMNDEAQQ